MSRFPGERNGAAKLTDDDVIALRRLLRATPLRRRRGLLTRWARRHEITLSCASMAASGYTWRHLPHPVPPSADPRVRYGKGVMRQQKGRHPFTRSSRVTR